MGVEPPTRGHPPAKLQRNAGTVGELGTSVCSVGGLDLHALTERTAQGMKPSVDGPDRQRMIAAATSLPLHTEPPAAPRPRPVDSAVSPNEKAEWTRDDFQRQIQPHLPRLHRMCLALCRDSAQAEDLLQNSLVKAYVGRHGFAGRGSLVGWLFGIVRHEHDELVRTATRRRSLLNRAIETCALAVEDLFAVPPPDPEGWVGLEEEGSILLECMRSIPEAYRAVLWLCDVEELSHEEIARTLDIAPGTVKSRHARGRAHLRLAYERRASGKAGGNEP